MQTSTLSEFIENWEFFSTAAYASTLAGALLGALGVYIILKRMVFLSAALSQVSSAGIALAFFLQALLIQGVNELSDSSAHLHHGHSHMHEVAAIAENSSIWHKVLDPVIIAALLSLVILIALGRNKKQQHNDTTIAFIYLAAASATLLIGTRITAEIQDIQNILIGNAVLVEEKDLFRLLYLSLATFAVHLYLQRGFELSTFYPESAQVAQIPVKSLQILLLITLALAIAISTQILGALPIFAFSCLPAIAARKLAPNLQVMFFLAALLGALSAFLGYLLAFLYAFPVGPAQATTAALLTGCLLSLNALWRLLWPSLKRKNEDDDPTTPDMTNAQSDAQTEA